MVATLRVTRMMKLVFRGPIAFFSYFSRNRDNPRTRDDSPGEIPPEGPGQPDPAGTGIHGFPQLFRGRRGAGAARKAGL